MSFTSQLTVTFAVAALATISLFAVAPMVQDIVQVLNANVIASAAVGLPILTTASLLVALILLQR